MDKEKILDLIKNIKAEIEDYNNTINYLCTQLVEQIEGNKENYKSCQNCFYKKYEYYSSPCKGCENCSNWRVKK